MVKLGFIVEGETEKIICESESFKSWLLSLNIELILPVIDAKGGGNLLPNNIETLVEILKGKFVDHIVVLTDIESEPNIITVKNRIMTSELHDVFVTLKAVESWFLASTPALRSWLKEADYYIDNPEDLSILPWDKLKEITKELGKEGPGPSKPLFAKKMIEKFGFNILDVLAHEKCNSVKYMKRKLENI
nr:hypothetical protein [Acinetobacter oleivorans]